MTSPDAPEGDELMVTDEPYGVRRCGVRSLIGYRDGHPRDGLVAAVAVDG